MYILSLKEPKTTNCLRVHTDGRDNEKLMTNAAMNKKERKHLVRDADNVSREDQMIVKDESLYW